MDLIFWVDKNTFSNGLLEKVFKTANIPFYTQTSAQDIGYLVEDLKPGLIVLDSTTYLDHAESFRQQYQASVAMQSSPFVIIDFVPSMDFIQHQVGQLKKPLAPFDLPQTLKNMLTVN